MALINKLSAIGNAIREKTGKADLLTLDQMPQEISSIETGGDTTIEDAVVSGRAIDTYTNNRITTARHYAFSSTNIKYFNSTSVTTLGAHCFSNSKFIEINIPNATYATSGASFYNLTALKKLYLPKIKSTFANNCAGCTALNYVYFEQVETITNGCFQNCKNLTKLVINKSTLCTLGNTNVFNGSAIANGTGFVYVPDNLVEKYKVATNWSTYASQIKPISELPTEEV